MHLLFTSSCILAQVKRLAEELGLEVVVAAIGVLKTGAGATRMGQEHISFKSSTPFISNLHVPGGDHELSIAALLAGTGGPLTAALDDPEQGSMLANACLESLASNACMAFHEWLQVSSSGRAACNLDGHQADLWCEPNCCMGCYLCQGSVKAVPRQTKKNVPLPNCLEE